MNFDMPVDIFFKSSSYRRMAYLYSEEMSPGLYELPLPCRKEPISYEQPMSLGEKRIYLNHHKVNEWEAHERKHEYFNRGIAEAIKEEELRQERKSLTPEQKYGNIW